MPGRSGWQKGGGFIQTFRNEEEAGGWVTKIRNVGTLELEHISVQFVKLTDRELEAN